MAATVNIYELNGGSPGTPTNKTSGTVRFKNADNATVDLNNPMVKPTSNFDSSFQKYLRLRIDDAGGFSQISNLRAYSDGGNGLGTGVSLYVIATGSYVAPADPGGTVSPPQYPETGSPQTAMVSFFTYTSGSPLDLDAINAGPFTNGSPTEWIGDFMVGVLQIDNTCSAGITPSETATFAYDEI
jgi:hypothetical protein